MTPSVLVTGGAGYIGSHACKALAVAGFIPVTYDDLSRGHASAVRWGPFERGDILDRARLDAVLALHRPIAAMHFAALTYVGESVADPAMYYRNNVVGSLTVLAALRAGGVDRIVFSSSCTTYGAHSAEPISEEASQAPVNPYGATKLIIEQALRDYAAAYGLKAAAMRYFNAAGADPDCEIGEAHEPEPHLIPLVLEAAASGSVLTINGDDYATPDGTCIRDYVHVADLADAHVRALKSLDREPGLDAFNLGAGRGLSNLEIVNAVRHQTGLDVRTRFGPRRAGDPPVLTADPTKAKRVLGWTQHHSGIAEIIDTAWHWRQRRQGSAGSGGAHTADGLGTSPARGPA